MSFDAKLSNDFLCVPRLPADAKGFVVWKKRLKLSIWAWGPHGHLDGTITRPDTLPPQPAGSNPLTKEQVSTNKRYTREMNQYLQEQAIVFQQIASTIPNSLYLKIKGRPTVQEAWDALKADFRRRSHMITIELRKQLQDTHCVENGNICTHFDNIQTL